MFIDTMSTPRITRSTVTQTAKTSRIPRPQWREASQANQDAADTASPHLLRGTKRRHVSEPSERTKRNVVAKESNEPLKPIGNCPKGEILETVTSKRPLSGTADLDEADGGTTKKRRRSSERLQQKQKKSDSPVSEKDCIQNQSKVSEKEPQGKSLPPKPSKTDSSPKNKIADDSVSMVSAGNELAFPRRKSTSGSKSRKSKRRSSFVRGRISKVAPVPTDVVLDIPTDLPTGDRLMKLSAVVFERTLTSLAEEFSDLEGFQQFQVEARDVFSSATETLRKNGAFQQATCTSRYLPNPANETMRKTIHDTTSRTDRLKKEFDRWKELFQEYEQKTAEAEKLRKETDQHPITEQPTRGFTPCELTFLDSRPNYQDYLNSLYDAREDAVLAVNDLVTVVSSLKKSQEKAMENLEERSLQIYKETNKDIEDFDNPQSLIAACLEFKST